MSWKQKIKSEWKLQELEILQIYRKSMDTVVLQISQNLLMKTVCSVIMNANFVLNAEGSLWINHSEAI